MLTNKITYICVLLLALTGCVKTPCPQKKLSKETRAQYQQQMQHWQAHGRIAIQKADQNINASFDWEQNTDNYRIHFFSPFSSETLTIIGDAQQFKVITQNIDNRDVQLEKNLPFSELSSWLKGMPAKSSEPNQAAYDSYNQLTNLQQGGWLIEYQEYEEIEPISLPTKLKIRKGTTYAKLVIKNWQK